jgi:hypothetical protein
MLVPDSHLLGPSRLQVLAVADKLFDHCDDILVGGGGKLPLELLEELVAEGVREVDWPGQGLDGLLAQVREVEVLGQLGVGQVRLESHLL